VFFNVFLPRIELYRIAILGQVNNVYLSNRCEISNEFLFGGLFTNQVLLAPSSWLNHVEIQKEGLFCIINLLEKLQRGNSWEIWKPLITPLVNNDPQKLITEVFE